MSDFGTPGSFPTPPTPPSSGARTGPPWEQPGAFFQRWFDTAKSILLDPQGGFRNVRRTGGLGAPLLYYASGAAPFILASILFQLIGIGGSMMGGGDVAGPAALVGGLGMVGVMLFMVVGIFVFFFIYTGLVHLTLSLLGGARHGYEATVRTFAYAHGSALPIGMVPFCGGAIAGIWALICEIFGLAEMQETTPVKSAIAIFAPLVLCCVVMFVFWAAIMAMIMGSAAVGGAAME
jgi:hypothetical protein